MQQTGETRVRACQKKGESLPTLNGVHQVPPDFVALKINRETALIEPQPLEKLEPVRGKGIEIRGLALEA